MKLKKRSIKALFTKKRRKMLDEKLEELNETLVHLSNLYDQNISLRKELAEGELKDKAIEIEKSIYGQKKVILCKMKLIDKELEGLA